MPTVIRFYRRDVYGQPKMYAADAGTASDIRALTGCATITEDHERALRHMGFTFTEVIAPSRTAQATR